jgi:hypothetical protein
MDRITVIYSLVDPRDGKVFYVGRTKTTLAWRLRGHLKDSRDGKNPKAKRIAQMLKDGVKPIIAEIARVGNVSAEEIEKTEQAWIDYLSITNTLLNVKPASAGGIGNGDGIRYNWTPEILAKLGKASDTDIAREMGIPRINAVTEKRQSLAIPRFTELKWTPEALSQLGKISDGAIAKSIGCSASVVRERRLKMGIPPAKPMSKKGKGYKSNWRDEIVSRLGQEPDKSIAESIDMTRASVSKYRQELGIKAYPKNPPYSYPKEAVPHNKVNVPQWVIDKLGTMADSDLAKLSGITHRIIWTRRQELGIPSYSEKNNHPTQYGYKPGIERTHQIHLSDSIIQQLGKRPDSQLAREAGVTENKIFRERTKRGIPVCPRPRNCYSNLPSSIVERLGKVQDVVLAKEAGVSKKSIQMLRYSLGIPSWRSTAEHPTSRRNKT